MKVYRADSAGNASGDPVATSAQGLTNFEQVALAPDPAPGVYVVRVVNFAALEPWTGKVTFDGPEPFKPALKEAWTLTCERPERTARSSRQVFVDRGERLAIDLRNECRTGRG